MPKPSFHKAMKRVLGFILTLVCICLLFLACSPTLMSEDKVAVILGTEGTGLAKSTIENSDYTVMIPMQNEVDSLNVAAAGVIAFWQLVRRAKVESGKLKVES